MLPSERSGCCQRNNSSEAPVDCLNRADNSTQVTFPSASEFD